MWKQWTNVALGIALVIVPFLGMAAVTLAWTLTIMGIAIAGLAFWSAQETNTEHERGRMGHRPRHT